ncbi:MAG: ribbon-helix-helix domain-containing protein [Actinobacteria bacterium]|nr:ribbon-helix-helix domain-containing protein [Actinomycetota bacterium]
MRTTIRIDDELYRSVKERAARTGRTVTAVIEDAIRLAFTVRRPSGDPEPTPVFGGSGTLPGVDLSDNAALRELMDGDGVDALR